jgi:bifunctional UDP-N-acetylglucosamine pyrophosphorylase/glucosamine-1-phosphate N-acetyltransferase
MSIPSPSKESSLSDFAALILAAGKSTRMKSKLPKPLHPLCGKALSRHVIDACRGAGIGRIITVVGHEADRVTAGLGSDIEFTLQKEQRGSGHAVIAARELLESHDGNIFIIAGDVPLLRSETIQSLAHAHLQNNASATMLTVILENPFGYGRVVRDTQGRVVKIVEQKDGTPVELAINECNPSIYCFKSSSLLHALGELKSDNAQGEFYLTDVIGILVQHGECVETMVAQNSEETLGVNTRVELAEVGGILRRRILNNLMLSGVSIVDPDTTYVDSDVQVGQDTILEPGTHLQGNSVIGANCVIGPSTRIIDAVIGDYAKIFYSQVVESEVGDHVRIGPYANIRPHCNIASHVKIGDFVELKNTILHENVSASHLSYIGDSEVGECTNIGAGTVTCNYDGFHKHRTHIGSNAFIGTHTTLIAPVNIGDGAFIAAGSPIHVDVPDDALAIARSRPTIKKEWAKNWREKHSKES